MINLMVYFLNYVPNCGVVVSIFPRDLFEIHLVLCYYLVLDQLIIFVELLVSARGPHKLDANDNSCELLMMFCCTRMRSSSIIGAVDHRLLVQLTVTYALAASDWISERSNRHYCFFPNAHAMFCWSFFFCGVGEVLHFREGLMMKLYPNECLINTWGGFDSHFRKEVMEIHFLKQATDFSYACWRRYPLQ